MPAIPATKRLASYTASSALKLAGLGRLLKKVLFFSPADDRIYPRRNLSAVIEKGLISVAFGSKVLSMISIKGAREYPFDESKYPQPEELASAVSLALSELGGPASEITLCLPKAWTIVKTVEFPVTVRENLPDVVRYEMDRITPFSSDDAYYDFRVLHEENDRLTLLVAAARTEVVLPYINALTTKGIRVSRLFVDLQAMLALGRHMDSRPGSLFLKVERDGYEGALDMAGPEPVIFADSFNQADESGQVQQLAAAIQSLPGQQAGGKAQRAMLLLRDGNPVLREHVKSRLNLPVTMAGETDLGVRFPAPVKARPFAAIAGVYHSLQAEASQMDLLRKGVRPQHKTPFVVTLFLLLGIVVVAGLYLVAPLQIETRRLRDISAQVASRKDEAKKIEVLQKEHEAISAEVATITDFKKPEPITLNILKEITSIMPKTAWLTRAKITASTVDIEGYAGSANELLPKLEASPYLRKVEFGSSTFRDARMNADRFIIKMEIEGAKKAEPAAPKGGGTPK
ncbi:MAG: PilN domain-containing protein [Thermodesulfovibrionales bacterium]